MYPTRGHAMVRRLDDHSYTLWLKHIIDCICDLSSHLFLNLQTLGKYLYDAGKLANANHTTAWNVGDPNLADDRRHVMFAMALEANATQSNHFVIPFDLLECLLQNLDRVLAVAGKKFFKRARHACGSLGQTITFWIVAGPLNNAPKCRFDVGSVWSIRRRTH